MGSVRKPSTGQRSNLKMLSASRNARDASIRSAVTSFSHILIQKMVSGRRLKNPNKQQLSSLLTGFSVQMQILRRVIGNMRRPDALNVGAVRPVHHAAPCSTTMRRPASQRTYQLSRPLSQSEVACPSRRKCSPEDFARTSPHTRIICANLRHLRTKLFKMKPTTPMPRLDTPEGDDSQDRTSRR